MLNRLHNVPLMVLTVENPLLRPGRNVLLARMGYYSNIRWFRRFRLEDNNNTNVSCIQFYLYSVGKLELFRQWWELAKCSSRIFEPLELYLNNNCKGGAHQWPPLEWTILLARMRLTAQNLTGFAVYRKKRIIVGEEVSLTFWAIDVLGPCLNNNNKSSNINNNENTLNTQRG